MQGYACTPAPTSGAREGVCWKTHLFNATANRQLQHPRSSLWREKEKPKKIILFSSFFILEVGRVTAGGDDEKRRAAAAARGGALRRATCRDNGGGVHALQIFDLVHKRLILPLGRGLQHDQSMKLAN